MLPGLGGKALVEACGPRRVDARSARQVPWYRCARLYQCAEKTYRPSVTGSCTTGAAMSVGSQNDTDSKMRRRAPISANGTIGMSTQNCSAAEHDAKRERQQGFKQGRDSRRLLTCHGHGCESAMLAASLPMKSRIATQPYTVLAKTTVPRTMPAPVYGTAHSATPSTASRMRSVHGFGS